MTNSKEICEEISFSTFFRTMLMSAFLLRFKANYLEKMRGYPIFSLWIPIALVKIYFFRVVLTSHRKPLYLVGTVLKLQLQIASVNQVRFSVQFVAAISQGFRTCLKLIVTLARQKLHQCKLPRPKSPV